tara:strand:+ start:1991 stop:2602 length:612 start_codon:yes stop_codon:yes gene_type:complete
MREILPGIKHWTVNWPGYFRLESYWIKTTTDEGVLVDPLEYSGIDEIEESGKVSGIILTNSSHERQAHLFAKRTGTNIYVPNNHSKKLETISDYIEFSDGDLLPGDFTAIRIATASSDEYALFSPVHNGTLVVGDSLGTSDKWVKGGLLVGGHPVGHPRPWKSLSKLLEIDFDNLLPGHGPPLIGKAKEAVAKMINDRHSAAV